MKKCNLDLSGKIENILFIVHYLVTMKKMKTGSTDEMLKNVIRNKKKRIKREGYKQGV